MGLDNGIYIKKNATTNLIGLNEKFYDEDDRENLTVCYWRKCWGLRNEIVNYLNETYGTDDTCGEWELDIIDIKEIINIVNSFFDKEKWSTEGKSIWFWKEAKNILFTSVSNLNYLIAKKEDFPGGFSVYFYDSY